MAIRLEKLALLLPCHSLEDFPLHHRGDDAQGLLSGWSALWHPQLLAAAAALPTWYRADYPPETVTGHLFALPSVSEPLLLAGWPARVATEGGAVLRKESDRGRLVAAALEAAGLAPDGCDPDLAADFMALGYGYLQTELLTRQMRYMSNLDEVHLEHQVRRAAAAALEHNAPLAREHLQNCFSVLLEARQRFYPAESYLVDLTLVADSTLGDALRAELQDDAPQNFLLTGQLLEQLFTDDTVAGALLRDRVQQGTASVVSGGWQEDALPLLPIENALSNLESARAEFERCLGRAPHVFARHRYGLAPWLPQLLSKLGYLGALHFTLDDGRFGRVQQSKTHWQGLDMATIDALAKIPLDATLPATYLGLAKSLAETMDLDHVATLVLAHWPGNTAVWFNDLQRINKYAPVFGRWITLDDYFQHTDTPGRLSRWTADDYQSPYLRQATERGKSDAISQFIHAASGEGTRLSAAACAAWSDLLGSPPNTTTALVTTDSPAPSEQSLRLAAERLAHALANPATAGRQGTLVVNPSSCSRSVLVPLDVPADSVAVEAPVRAVQADGAGSRALVDVPPWGFAWLAEAPTGGAPPRRRRAALADGVQAKAGHLRNEYLSLTLDEATGGIRSLWDTRARGNLLSQQLAVRLPAAPAKPGEVWRDPDQDARYSRMVADTIELASVGPAVGELVARGRLVDEQDSLLARFEQRVRLIAGGRVAELEITLDPQLGLEGDPWRSYIAARVAWPEPEAELCRGVLWSSQTTGERRIESAELLEWSTSRWRLTLLAGGLAFHRRTGERMLDTLLVTPGERQRTFRLGYGLNLPHAGADAQAWSIPPLICPAVPPPAGAGASAASGWLFRIEPRHVVVTHWESCVTAEGQTGLSFRLLEVGGRGGVVTIEACRPFTAGWVTDFRGQTLQKARVEGGAIKVDLSAHEWTQIHAVWSNNTQDVDRERA